MLQIKGISCGYDVEFLLRDIHFEVDGGELVGIIGPNGSGKTTLLRAISRVLKLQKGKILFEGRDINQMGYKELAQEIAVVSQITQAIGFNLTVNEFVLLGRIPYRRRFQLLETRADEEIAHQAMSLTDILHLRTRNINELSGGERQRAVIARALAQEPSLLLLDEPTTHLDIGHQIEILDLIKTLNREKALTVIVVLHDLNLASEYCHRLVLLKQGEVYQIGTPREVLSYSTIEEVYETLVLVQESPVSSKPQVFLIPGGRKRDGEDKKIKSI